MDSLELMKIVRSGRIIDKNFDELKQGYNDYDKIEQKPMPIGFNMENKFNINKFYTFFKENRFETNNDDGYGDIMTPSSNEREDIKINKTIQSETLFNNEFDKYKKKKNKDLDLTIYKVPEPLSSSNNTYEQLGDNTNNYTYSSDNLSYTDYKDAVEQQNNMLLRGFEGSFVVAFKDGKKIGLYAAIRAVNGKLPRKSTSEYSPKVEKPNVEYVVQIGVYKENVPANVLAKMTKIGEVVKENINNSKLYRYYAGTYNDYAAANTRLQEVKTAGFNDAFVKPLLDGKQISIQNAKTLSE